MIYEILRILFPSPCALCGYLGDMLCKECFAQVEFKPHLRKIGELEICSAMYYEKNVLIENLIHAFKYNHQKDLFRFFVPFIEQSVKLLSEPEKIVLVPVPLHKKREFERGYNQSEVLANYIAKKNGIAVLKILERVKNTTPQAQIASKLDRKENIRSAFRINAASGAGVKIAKDMHLVLVDDIVTSGSTLIECRETLLRAGYTKISALTLADRESIRN